MHGPSSSRPATAFNASAPRPPQGPPQKRPAQPSGSSRGEQQQGKQSQQREATAKVWLLDGRLYNYAKPGATEFTGADSAKKALEAAKAAGEAIHGFGRVGHIYIMNFYFNRIKEDVLRSCSLFNLLFACNRPCVLQ